MAETLLTLIKNIIKENRAFVLDESNKYKKLKLINSQLNNEFKTGINKNVFFPYFKFYLKDKVLFDSDDFDCIIINIGIKFLHSILKNLIYLDINCNNIIDNDILDDDIKNFFGLLYSDYDVVTFFEISDKEARLSIIMKGTYNKLRKTCKVFNDFPFYNMKIKFLNF